MFDITLIHPKVVDFTIALFSMAVLLDIIGKIAKNEKFYWAAWINLAFAGVAAVLSVVSGLLAANNVPHSDAAHQIMETHETLGFIVLGAILALLAWRIFLKGKFPVKAAWLYLLIGVAGFGVMATGAYYGGEMVFTHGVAVKAAPVSEHEAGHHHGENEHEQENPAKAIDAGQSQLADPTSQADSFKTAPDSLAGRKKVHIHADGKEHVH